MCGKGENGKLEEALRPVFDLSCFSFLQQFDPEMRPLSFLRASVTAQEKAITGDEAGIITPARVACIHSFLSLSLGLLFHVSLHVCLSVCPSGMKSK